MSGATAPKPASQRPPLRPDDGRWPMWEPKGGWFAQLLKAGGLGWILALTQLGVSAALVAVVVFVLKADGLDPGLRAVTVLGVCLMLTILGLAAPLKGHKPDATTEANDDD